MKKATFLIAGLIITQGLWAQEQMSSESQVIYGVYNGISKPMRDLPDFEGEKEHLYEMTESKDKVHRQPQIFQFTAEKDGAAYGNDPNSIQKSMGTRAMLPTISSFAGQNGGGYPPDPSGAAGPNHYVQAVNATPFKVFNKATGAQLMAPKNIGTLWSPATGNMGDPIIMYDRYADRWFVSQFGASNSIYIAISTTPDPTGTYHTYTFTSSQFPDYLKFSIWGDGYYMTSNQSTDKLFVFERDKMLLGQTARSVVANFTTGTVTGFFCPLAADADGGLPPAGTACPFFWYTENSWGGGNVDGIKYIKATVNWTPATPTLTMSSTTTIPTAAFDGTYDPSWNDVVQPGTTAKLDGIGGVPTYRAQYRRWAGYNTVVLNWGVKISSTQRSIKWVELRETTPGTWTLYQEGIYSPDTKSRWVGSIAMDDNGSIALCYARSASTTSASDVGYPSLGFTGRLASDPLGQMTFAETMVRLGSGVQTSNNRFGDYSQTSLDPDGITFWHTGEYLQTGPRTWIYSFQLPLPTGVEESQNQINNVTAYQSLGGITVNATNIKEEGELVVDLFDITGKQIDGKQIVANGGAFETSFSTSNLASGTYLVRVGKMNTSFQKVVKVVVK
ncbi:MAG: T9SS type A sorting domain-containing protein [Bacteroidetes bacterium]|nr:T9SS type A sorting domain-containing protein [Bacteroidota bacterium]